MKIEFEHLIVLADMIPAPLGLKISSELSGLIQVYSIEQFGLIESYSVFETHRKIQEEVTFSNAVNGYAALLDNLKVESEFADPQILQINVVTENKGYIFFTSLNYEKMYGVLSMNKQKLSKESELNSDGTLRGTWTNRQFYLNGQALN